jgi:excisionase family DNA binding protein
MGLFHPQEISWQKNKNSFLWGEAYPYSLRISGSIPHRWDSSRDPSHLDHVYLPPHGIEFFPHPQISSEDSVVTSWNLIGVALIGRSIMAITTHTKTLSTWLNELKTECQVPMAKDEWLSPTALSEELGVHINSIYRWIRSEELKAYNLGTNGKTFYRIKRTDVEAWLEAKTNQRLSPSPR